MSETSADDVVPRDPHLRAALRHAPDAQAEPPQAVSAAILRRAREAVRAGTKTERHWFTMAGAASPMPWAGGFAGLLLAVLAGLLWWPEPPPPPGERASSPSPGAPSEPALPTQPQPPPDASLLKDASAERQSAPPRPPARGQRAIAQGGDKPDAAAPKAASPSAAAPAQSAAAPSSDQAAAARLRAPAEAERREADVAAVARGPSLPSDLDAPAWLRRLDGEAGARWQRYLHDLPAGRTYRWPAEPQPPRVTVVLTPAGAYWRDDANTWFVPLTPAQIERLGQP